MFSPILIEKSHIDSKSVTENTNDFLAANDFCRDTKEEAINAAKDAILTDRVDTLKEMELYYIIDAKEVDEINGGFLE